MNKQNTILGELGTSFVGLQDPQTRRAVFFFIGIGCVITVVWTRLLYLTANFGNFDVAGIVYNAEFILDGGLPYRDTYEVKAPLTFYLFAVVFWLFEPSLIYIRLVWGIWHLGACVTLFGIGKRLGQPFFGALAAVLLTVYGVLFDINYSSWLVLPLSLVVYSYVRAYQKNHLLWYAAAGAAASMAFLTKKPGGIIVILLGLLVLVDFLKNRETSNIKRFIAQLGSIGGGCFVALLPLLLLYGWHGELFSLLDGLFGVSFLLKTLSAKGTSDGHLVFYNLGHGLMQIFQLFPLPAGMALISLIVMAIRKRIFSGPGLLAFAWFVLSFASVAITGGRFYPHHTILYLPSLCLLAAQADGFGWIFGWLANHKNRILAISGTAVLAFVCLSVLLYAYYNIIQDRRVLYDWVAPVGKPEPQKNIGAYIRERTQPKDTIIAWGWFAWPIYHWSGRRSPSPIYKEMGAITDINTNTEWTPSKPIRFTPGDVADKYLKDVITNRPAFIVISDWYPWISASKHDPILEFQGLMTFMNENYLFDHNYRGFKVFRRSDIDRDKT